MEDPEGCPYRYIGPDLPYKIHKHLENLEKASENLTWVLLVGDSQHIPVRYLRANGEAYGFDKDYAGDFYYTGLDSDWDTNGNGIYGEYTTSSGYEADLYTDAYVGRWPVDNRTQVAWLVDKVLNYEKAPPAGNWVREFEMWGTLMDAPNDATKYDSYEDNAFKVCQKIYDEVLIPNYSNVTNTDFNVTRRYDYAMMQGGLYSKANDQLKNSVILAPMNRGVSIVNFAGQAYYDGTRLAHYVSDTGMDDTNVGAAWPGLLSYADDAALTNGYKLPFIFAATCDAANFTKTNDQGHEQLFMNPNGGAIGFLSNTGTSYRGENADGTSNGNWWLNFEFWHNFKFDLNTQPAKCWFDTLETYRDDVLMHQPVKGPILSNLYGYLYMGDPEVDIWTDTPAPLTLQAPQLFTGSRNYTFKVMADGKPVPYARICMRSADMYETFTANISGVAVHQLSFPAIGSVDLTVTGHNGIYNMTTLSVLTAPPDLYINPASIHFSNTSALKAGDDVNISVTVLNIGGLSATGAQVKFFDGVPGVDPNATQIETAFSLGNLGAGASKQAWVMWTASAGNHTILVSSTSGASDLDPSNNNASKTVTALYPDLEIRDSDLQFTPGGTVIAGALLNISFTVSNNGTCDAHLVKVAVYDGQMSGGVLIGETILSIVPTAGSAAGYVLWTVTPQDHAIYAYVDPAQEIFEYDRLDNVAYGLLDVDSPPAFHNMTDMTIIEDASPIVTQRLLDLTKHVTDPDNAFLGLTFSAIATGPNAVVITGAFVNVTLKKDWYGMFVINITASDPLTSATASLNVTVTAVNDPPVLNLTKKVFSIYEHTQFTLKINAYDVEGGALTFADDTPLFDIDPSTGIINYTPRQEDLDKTFFANITVADAIGASATEMLQLNVIGVNDRPHIDPIENRTVWVGSALDLTVKASDPDDDTLTFTDNTPMFDINATTGRISYLPVKEQAGNRNVTITVSDGELSDSYTFMITVRYNATDGPDDDVADDDSTPFVGSAAFYGLLIGLILIVIIVIVAIVLVARRKKEEDRPASRPTDKDTRLPEEFDDAEGDSTEAPPIDRAKGKRPRGPGPSLKTGDGGKHPDKKGQKTQQPQYRDDDLTAGPTESGPVQYEGSPDDIDAHQEGTGGAVPADVQGPESYAEKGEMGFDDDSFDEAFGDEPAEDDQYPELNGEDTDVPNDRPKAGGSQRQTPSKRGGKR